MSDTAPSIDAGDQPPHGRDVPPSRFVQVSAEFERLRTLGPELRDDALRTLRSSRPDIGDEVEELLRHHADDDGLLDAPLIRPGTPSRIGRYRPIRLLGEGGMGTVWLAEQEEPVRREVALKLIKLGMDTRQVIRRFEAERQVLARMEHPGIARVLDAGITGDGRPYFVMELVRGERITDYADRLGLSPAVRLRLFQQVCAAVQHAHGKGVIHRDLKPSNVLVTEVDGAPAPKVIDFGVAKVLDDPRDEATRFTSIGHAIGTPDYMSPEQAGLAESGATKPPGGADVDIRSDVWSLGVLLFELLTGTTPSRAVAQTGTGRLPLTGDRTTRTTIVAPRPSSVVASRRRGTTTDEQESRALRRGMEPSTLRRLLRAELDWIVLRALEIDPARRYGTVAALSDDISRFLENRPIAARPSAALYEARKFARRHVISITAGTLVVLALAVGLMTALYGLDRARTERDRAIDAQQREARLAMRLRDELTANMIERGRLAGYSGNISLASSLLWDAHLQHRESGAARWALRELLMRQPLRMSHLYEGDTPFGGTTVPDEHEALLIVGSEAPPILIDRDTGHLIARFSGDFEDEMRSVDVSPSSETAVTGDRGGRVRLLSIPQRREIATLLATSDGLVVARFLDDSTVIAADGEGRLHRIPIAAPDLVESIDLALSPIEQLAVHAQSGRIAVGARNGEVLMLEQFGATPVRLDSHDGLVMCLAFDPDGRTLASGGNDRIVRVHDLAEGRLVHSFDPRNGSIRDLHFADGGRTLHVLGWWRLDAVDLTADPATWTPQELIAEGGWRIVPHSDPARTTIVGRNRQHIRHWQLDASTLLDHRALDSDWTVRIVGSPCGSATVGHGGTRAGGHDADGGWRWQADLESATVVAIAVSSDGRRVALGGSDRRVRVHDLRPASGTRLGPPLVEIPEYLPGSARSIAFIDEDTLVMPTIGNAIVRIDLRDGSRTTLLEVADTLLPGGPISADHSIALAEVVRRPMRMPQMREVLVCVVSPDGRYLGVGQRGALVHLIDLVRGTVRTAELESANFALAFSTDGRHLITGGWTGVVSVFDVSTFERRWSQEHSALVTNITPHPHDADLFASVASDGTVRLWSAAECRNLFWLAPLGNANLTAVGFDRAGGRIAIAAEAGRVASWDLDLADAFIEANREFELSMRSRNNERDRHDLPTPAPTPGPILGTDTALSP